MKNKTTDNHTTGNDLFRLEKAGNLFVLHGLPYKGMPAADLEVIGQLWKFFETIAHDPPQVLLLEMQENIFGPSDIEHFWKHLSGDGSKTSSEIFSNYPSNKIHENLSRIEYGAARFAEYVLSLDSLVLISVQGDIAFPFLGLILACDFRICSDNTRFLNDCINGNRLPMCGLSYYMVQYLGLSKAKELLFNTDRIDAQKAMRLGLINRIVPELSAKEQSLKCALEFARKPRSGLLTMKRTLAFANDQFKNYIRQELKALKWGTSARSSEENNLINDQT